MLTSVDNVNTQISRDSQKENVYLFDDILWETIKVKGMDYPKLFGNRNIEDIRLQDIADVINADFQLGLPELTYSTGDNFFSEGRININHFVAKEKNFEVLLHEFAHAFDYYLFDTPIVSVHGAKFLSTLRFLLNHYEVLSFKEFDELLESHLPTQLECHTDLVDAIIFCNKQELNNLKEQYNANQNQEKREIFYSHITKLEIKEEQHVNLFFESRINDQCYFIRMKRFAFEYKTPFTNITVEELNNIVLLSPVFMMDDNGNKITAEFWNGNYGFIEETVTIPNIYGHNLEPIKYYPDKDGKKEANKERNRTAKEFKKNGRTVLKPSSYKEYSRLHGLMREKYFELR